MPTADHRGSAYLGVLTAGCKFLILFIEYPSPRGVRGLVKKNIDCTVSQNKVSFSLKATRTEQNRTEYFFIVEYEELINISSEELVFRQTRVE